VSWTQVRVVVDGEAAEAVAEALRPFAYGGVSLEQTATEGAPDRTVDLDSGVIVPELDPWVTVSIYLPLQEDTPAKRRRIEEVLWHMGRLYPIPGPTFRTVGEEDWADAWKQHYAPIRIGERLHICPTWETPALQPGDILLLMDPGMAFGTGLHPTTRMCLEVVEERVRPNMSVLDLGTGSGILAIAAARLGAGPVLALDIDGVAVQAARENCALNQVTDQVRVRPGSLGDLSPDQNWDLVLLNILAPTILQFFQEGLVQHVRPEGMLILSGIIEEQAPQILTAMEENQLSLVEQRQVKDWVTLVGRRR
jgi:ribosomal protein L11 methyltransferase